MRRVFLKLNGTKGETPRGGHLGEIEIASFYWGGGNNSPSRGGRRRRDALKDLTIIKRLDKSTAELQIAALTGEIFQGRLTLEDLSASGDVVRSIVFELDSVGVDSVTDIESGELVNLTCRSIKLLRFAKGKFGGEGKGDRKKELVKKVKNMKRNLVIISIFLIATALFVTSAAAQFTIKLPNIKINKPDKDGSKIKDGQTGVQTNNVKKPGSKLLYPLVLPTNVPVFLKNSVHVSTVVVDEYWKTPKEKNHASWVPKLRFEQFYNEERVLNYAVEYFNPDGSPWFVDKLGSSGRSAERTVTYESPSPFGNGVLDTKSTDAVGVFSFKVTDEDTKQVLYQGKFKVGKFSRAYSAQEKNKMDFYVEHDWVMPFGVIGFHHSIDEAGAMKPEVSVWLKGAVEANELEGRVFYNGRQIASTKDEDGGSVGTVEERAGAAAAAFTQHDKIWKRWQFDWNNFRVHNNGGFNPENFPRAHFADKNPGEYTFKIYRNGAQIRELSVTVGADGRFVRPAYADQVPMPYYRMIVPVKISGSTEKYDPAAWKTEAFYGNPLSGFSVQ